MKSLPTLSLGAAILMLTVVACTDDATAPAAAQDTVTTADAATTDDSSLADAGADVSLDIIEAPDGRSKPGVPDTTASDAPWTPDAAPPVDTTVPTDTTLPEDTTHLADTTLPEDTTLPCEITINHDPLASAEIGDIPITAAVAGATIVTLHFQPAQPGGVLQSVPMTWSGASFAATIPGDALTFAGVYYSIEAKAPGCAATSPGPEAPEPTNFVALYGEKRLTVDTDVYSYQPAVFGHRVVYANEEKGGQSDNVYLFDLHTFDVTNLTQHPKPQGAPRISGDNVIWVDLRNSKSEWDPNNDIYLQDLAKVTTHQVTTDPLGQYGATVFGHLIAWRDDRNTTGPINGDIYLYDMGPDATFGTADDVGELRLNTDPTDQTAPDVWVDKSGRALIVWEDLRDDADGVCAAECNTNIYLYDTGPDGIYGTADDSGEVRVTDQADEQTSPAVSGTRIAWRDARGGNWLDPDIYLYDLGPDGVFGTADDGGEQLLDVPTKEPGHLDFSGDRLVWDDFRNENWDVWLYDFATGTELQVTDHPRGQFYPRIHGKTIVWQDARNNDPDGEPFDDVYVRVLP